MQDGQAGGLGIGIARPDLRDPLLRRGREREGHRSSRTITVNALSCQGDPTVARERHLSHEHLPTGERSMRRSCWTGLFVIMLAVAPRAWGESGKYNLHVDVGAIF